MLETLSVEYKEGETTFEELCNQIAEKYDAIPPTEPQEGEANSYMTQEQAKEKLGKELSADEVLNSPRKVRIITSRLSMMQLQWGVRAQGNDFSF